MDPTQTNQLTQQATGVALVVAIPLAGIALGATLWRRHRWYGAGAGWLAGWATLKFFGPAIKTRFGLVTSSSS